MRKSLISSALMMTMFSATAVVHCALPVPDEIPRAWNLKDIEKATPPYGVEGRLDVLAWTVIQDARPWRTESCLVLKVLDKDDGYGKWCLASLYRLPGQDNSWRVAKIHVKGRPGSKEFPGLWIFRSKRIKEPPGNSAIYKALGDVGWSFKLDKGWKYVSCCVCEHGWQQALGEKPTQFFE
jgi:hypothetical protein